MTCHYRNVVRPARNLRHSVPYPEPIYAEPSFNKPRSIALMYGSPPYVFRQSMSQPKRVSRAGLGLVQAQFRSAPDGLKRPNGPLRVRV